MQQLALWCVTDNKPGHLSQLQGLVRALEQRQPLDLRWIDARQQPGRLVVSSGAGPDLIIAAGHGTHLTALRLKWRFGGRLVAIMKPSLPRVLFDLCVIPEHDGVAPSARVLTTRGAINDIEPAADARADLGLILVGGPSKHHGWSDEQLAGQLRELQRLLPGIHWTLTTSRRTPASFVTRIAGAAGSDFVVVPYDQTDREWLREKYRRCGVIWVTEDSASMVYEALTAGARVGVLPVPRRREGRVSRGLDRLCDSGRVTTLEQLRARGTMPVPGAPLSEAARVAEYLQEWLQAGRGGQRR